MARTVGIGIQDFAEIITNDYFYIDKTDFIKEWWESGDSVTLITRPRRFGKTLNMNMLDYFFSVKHVIVDLSAVLIILSTSLGGDGEALRNRQTDIGHLSKVCTLAAQQLTHSAVAFGKQVNELLGHWFYPFHF